MLGVKCLTNVCVMYVMMYVVCAGRTDRQVALKLHQIVDIIEISIHSPSPRCPPLRVFRIRAVRRRLMGSFTHEYYKVSIHATHD